MNFEISKGLFELAHSLITERFALCARLSSELVELL